MRAVILEMIALKILHALVNARGRGWKNNGRPPRSLPTIGKAGHGNGTVQAANAQLADGDPELTVGPCASDVLFVGSKYLNIAPEEAVIYRKPLLIFRKCQHNNGMRAVFSSALCRGSMGKCLSPVLASAARWRSVDESVCIAHNEFGMRANNHVSTGRRPSSRSPLR